VHKYCAAPECAETADVRRSAGGGAWGSIKTGKEDRREILKQQGRSLQAVSDRQELSASKH